MNGQISEPFEITIRDEIRRQPDSATAFIVMAK